jgi:hypothetical protein
VKSVSPIGKEKDKKTLELSFSSCILVIHFRHILHVLRTLWCKTLVVALGESWLQFSVVLSGSDIATLENLAVLYCPSPVVLYPLELGYLVLCESYFILVQIRI